MHAESRPGRPPRADSQKTRRVRSAGGVLYERDQIVLIAVSRGRRWQLPKGRIERGESPAQAARREVFEETGVDGTVVRPIRRIDFSYEQRSGTVVEKSIDFFLLHYLSGDVDGYDPHEVTEARWFSWHEALERLTFANERGVVEDGWQLWQKLEATAEDGDLIREHSSRDGGSRP